MFKRRSGFTLVELLIVMGIIILVVTMAIPSIRVMTGGRSVSVAQNQLAAVITRAREDAIALQAVRGVLFYLDPATGRVGAVIVQQAAVNDSQDARFNTILLDTLPGNDSLLLPTGVGLQTLFNGFNGAAASARDVHTWQVAMATQAAASAAQTDDRYLGFNPVAGGTVHGAPQLFYAGGCILFDGSGRLIVRPYAFQMTAFSASGAPTASNLCNFMGYGDNSFVNNGSTTTTITYSCPSSGSPSPQCTYFLQPPANGSMVVMPGCANQTNATTWNGNFPAVPVMSQIGFVLFDHDAFRGLGFTDYDADITGNSYTSAWLASGSPGVSPGVGGGGGDGVHTEADEETWLDSNTTPIMINRYNGTLIRGE